MLLAPSAICNHMELGLSSLSRAARGREIGALWRGLLPKKKAKKGMASSCHVTPAPVTLCSCSGLSLALRPSHVVKKGITRLQLVALLGGLFVPEVFEAVSLSGVCAQSVGSAGFLRGICCYACHRLRLCPVGAWSFLGVAACDVVYAYYLGLWQAAAFAAGWPLWLGQDFTVFFVFHNLSLERTVLSRGGLCGSLRVAFRLDG